jgi:hypothetical protein
MQPTAFGAQDRGDFEAFLCCAPRRRLIRKPLGCFSEKQSMNFMRRHWFDLGVALAGAVSIALFFTPLSLLSLVLWLSLIAL